MQGWSSRNYLSLNLNLSQILDLSHIGEIGDLRQNLDLSIFENFNPDSKLQPAE